MPATIWIDGAYYDRDSAKVSVFDHGLLYGDGVFEGMRTYGGKVFRLREHIRRLYDSAKAIALTVPMSMEEMERVTNELVERSGIGEAYLRHVVTRGTGDLGLDLRNCKVATVIIICDQLRMFPPERFEAGLKLVTAGTPTPHRESLSPRVKSLNYLPHVMAKFEGTSVGADEVLMLDASGFVAEASGQNVFVVKDGVIRTPPPSAGILKGVTRDVVLELCAALGITVQQDIINRYDVYTADELFLSGTATELVPVREVDSRTIGAVCPGPVTRKLREAFQALVRPG
jgi:branched-chain amino acid aminotransferase